MENPGSKMQIYVEDKEADAIPVLQIVDISYIR